MRNLSNPELILGSFNRKRGCCGNDTRPKPAITRHRWHFPAREAGLVCNLFFADSVAEARRFLEIGIDVILTNRGKLLFEGGVAEPLPMAMKAIT